MENPVLLHINEIQEIHFNPHLDFEDKYARYRTIVESILDFYLKDTRVQFANLFSKMSYVINDSKLSSRNRSALHRFRKKANRILHKGEKATSEEYLFHLNGILFSCVHFFNCKIPKDLFLDVKDVPYLKTQKDSFKERIDFYRVCVTEIDKSNDCLTCTIDDDDGKEITVRYNVDGVNHRFKSASSLWVGACLALHDVNIDDNGDYFPNIFIIEPDYLFTASSIAACFKENADSWINHIKGNFSSAPNTKHIRLGNYANTVLDQLVNTRTDEFPAYSSILKQDFVQYPIEYTTCENIDNEYSNNCQLHYENLKNIVINEFKSRGVSNDNVILEPTFYAPKFGIQGRLDVYAESNEKNTIIELKSGSPPFRAKPTEIKKDHEVQLHLYYQLIRSVKELSFKEVSDQVEGYILYSKIGVDNLRHKTTSLGQLQEIFEMRNNLLLFEYALANSREWKDVKQIIDLYNPSNLFTKPISERFRVDFIEPQIKEFTEPWKRLSDLEQSYIYSYIRFIALEKLLSRVGSTTNNYSISSHKRLWRNSLKQKTNRFEIFYDLTINQNNANTSGEIVLNKTNEANKYSNIRKGDICILYPKTESGYDITKDQLYKATIKEITSSKIIIQLRYKQGNLLGFDGKKYWALERDYMDTGYRSMYTSIYDFINAPKGVRNKIMGLKKPESNSVHYHNENLNEDQNRIIGKAVNCEDYFLLWGPPGTGKTSIILKHIVEHLYTKVEPKPILLLAYTNKAVDEICAALESISETIEYIRIGKALSCREQFHTRLLDHILGAQHDLNRQSIKEILQKTKIVVSTVASVQSKKELFNLIDFEYAIVDEASQILEPQIIGILSKVSKFILIGDHKQLPAIVLQETNTDRLEDDTTFKVDEGLKTIGLINFHNSLFERLYKLCQDNSYDNAFDKLTKQGRMHKDVAKFTSSIFYPEIQSSTVFPRQINVENKQILNQSNSLLNKLIEEKRFLFLANYEDDKDTLDKANLVEAEMVIELIKRIRNLYGSNYNASKTIGVITPYKNQIALIKDLMEKENIPEREKILIDTVERFQGGQRDVIIISFAVETLKLMNGLVKLDDSGKVDRKLNVALTRAKEQVIMLGNPSILSSHIIYYKLIEYCKSIKSLIELPYADLKFSTNSHDEELVSDDMDGVLFLEPQTESFFNEKIIENLKSKPTTQFPKKIIGYNSFEIRNNIIEYGRSDFDKPYEKITGLDKVTLYCYYNMRKHLLTCKHIFNNYKTYLSQQLEAFNNRYTFIDLGCGPMTGLLAFKEVFKELNFVNYLGIDRSENMIVIAKLFQDLIKKNSSVTNFNYRKSFEYLDEITDDGVPNLFIINCSYLFTNLSTIEVEFLTEKINEMIKRNGLSKFIFIYSNTSSERKNYNYQKIFKPSTLLKEQVSTKELFTIQYKNQKGSQFSPKEETYFNEILSN